MTSSYSEKIAKLKNALENVFVKKTDIQNNLTSTDTNKPLSANQGKVLKTLVDEKANIDSIPTKTSDLTNDSGFLTEHQSLSNYYTKSEIDNIIGYIEEDMQS